MPVSNEERPAQAVRPGIDGRRRWWILAAALAVLLLLLILAASLLTGAIGPQRDRFWDRIQQSGQWRVGMDPSFPPFEDLDESGQLEGFDVDLARAIAVRWGVEADIVSVGFDSLTDAVWANRLDSAISAMPYQPHLTEDLAFSAPYFEAGLVLVVPAGEQAIRSENDLAGRRLAVEWGSEGDVRARDLLRRFPDLEILPLESPQAALEAVVGGSADAAMVDRISALQFDGGAERTRILAPALVSDPYVIVLPRRAPMLQAQVADALEALRADGTLDALSEKWFGSPAAP